MREFVDTLTPPRAGVPKIERTIAQAIVRHPEQDRYLLLKKAWETESYSYPTGGIDPGELVVDAAKREVQEETGYFDFREAYRIGEAYKVSFYHESKRVNRLATVLTVVIRLGSLRAREVSAEEKALHQAEWVSAEEVRAKIHGEGARFVFEEYLGSQASG